MNAKETIHILENSQLRSACFTEASLTAAYVEVLACLYSADKVDTVNPEKSDDNVPCLDPDVFILIKSRNQAKSESGIREQRLSAAFVDGYLSAHAELQRFITKLYHDRNPEVCPLYAALKPLIERQDSNYYKLCDNLNRPEQFDCAAENEAS